ncbi:MAG: hypothetical protein HOV86_26130 [Thermoactinospora sp.]|nr:hypothetical protein [Thermoactinospora sp.]
MRAPVKRGLTVAVASGVALLMLAGRAGASEDVQAFGIDATLLGSINFGPAPLATLSDREATLASLDIGDAANGVETGVMEATVTQDVAAGTETATASVNGLSAGVAGVTIAADSVVATCTATFGDTTTGSATLSNATVTVAGVPITLEANPEPDTVIAVPPGPLPPTLVEIILNEQIRSGDKLTVNAIHVRAASGVGDLIISSASCGPAPEPTSVPIPIASGAGLFAGLGMLAAAGGAVAYVRRRKGLGLFAG